MRDSWKGYKGRIPLSIKERCLFALVDIYKWEYYVSGDGKFLVLNGIVSDLGKLHVKRYLQSQGIKFTESIQDGKQFIWFNKEEIGL